MINEMLAKLKLPSPLCINGERVTSVEKWEKARPLVLKMMLECEYGYMPEEPEKISVNKIEEDKIRYCAGKAEGNEFIGDIIDRFDYWFCENYKNFYGKDNETPFEQHFLSALIAPRRVHIASAKEDIWAGPNLEFLFCAASSEVYELYGKKGFVYEDGDFLKCGKYLNEGNVGLCYREGRHYFSRDDWHGLIDSMNK